MSLEYDSDTLRSPAVEEFIELWRYRDLLQLMVQNSIKTRYKRSSLGIVWTLLNPLLNTIILSIVFSFFFSRFAIENYPIYLLSGFLLWNFFSQSTLHSMNTLVWGSSLLKRVYVPRTIFAVSVLGNGLINLLLGLIPLVLIMVILRQPFTPALLFLPLGILLLAMFTLGFTLFISTVAVFFVDVVDMFSILLSAWFYLTPVIYPLSLVPEQYRFLLKLNPMYYLLEVFRSVIFFGTIPDAATIILAGVISTVTLGLGWWLFTRKADEFTYHI